MKLTVEADGQLRVSWGDGAMVLLHPLWLRERMPDPRILDPLTGQRLIEATDLPLDLKISRVEGRQIVFSDDFTADLPEAWARALAGHAPEDCQVLWDGGLSELPEAPFERLRASEGRLGDFLDDLNAYGFAVVRGVPVEIDGALDFARLIGPIRITNWGGLADVKAIPQAYDLTMTPRHLEPHSDNPYRQPVPGYILLHCLTNDAEGGDSTVVDGFHAARRLEQDDPEAFATLTTTPVYFRYADRETLLENRGPLIERDGSGRIVQVRYSNRTEMIDALPAAALDRYYRARAAFRRLIDPASDLTLRFKLQPGDLMMMDNYRLLHGRTGYRLDTGSRHMRQCYMDRDIVQSRRKTLRARATAA